MAKSKRATPRAAANGGGPRRLGGQSNTRQAPSASAQRRMARSHRNRSRRYGWIAVVVVVVVILAIVLPQVLSSSSKPSNDAAGHHPPAASPAVVRAITTIPTSTYDKVGTAGLAVPFSTPKHPVALGTPDKPEFVYLGGEFCPYCAVMRWSIISALSRFGTWSGLKQISSAGAPEQVQDVPTFSFHGATYTSKYLTFTGIESEDRLEQPFEPVPERIQKLIAKYDYPPYVPAQSPGGIPFLDIAGHYYSSGVSPEQLAQAQILQHGGPGRLAIAHAVRNPTSQVGKGLHASVTIGQANYISAAICKTNGMRPGSVCTSAGVKAALGELAKAPVKG